MLIAAVNSQARLIFNAGREGLLPRWIGRVEPSRQVPRNAIFTFVGIASVIIGVWALGHLIFGHSGSMDGLTYFDESGTMGTILVLVVYFLANLAVPFYYRKYRPSEFSVIKHAVLPVLGMIAIAVPVYYLSKPGQSAPYSWFPYVALGILIVSVIYAAGADQARPGAGRAGRLHRRRRVGPGPRYPLGDRGRPFGLGRIDQPQWPGDVIQYTLRWGSGNRRRKEPVRISPPYAGRAWGWTNLRAPGSGQRGQRRRRRSVMA